MGSGGSQSSKSTNVSQPWSGQQPYLSSLYQRADQAYGGGELGYYPGQTYAERDPAYTQALDRFAAEGQASPIAGGATGLYQDTVSGRYLEPGSNPYLDATYDRAASRVGESFNRDVMPALASRFEGAGRSHSGAYEGAVGRATDRLGDQYEDLATSIYGGNYQQERGRQMQALGMTGMVQDARRAPMENLREAGREREAYDQVRIDDLIQRFEFARDEPYMRTERYGGLIGAPVMQSASRSSAGSNNSLWGWLGF